MLREVRAFAGWALAVHAGVSAAPPKKAAINTPPKTHTRTNTHTFSGLHTFSASLQTPDAGPVHSIPLIFYGPQQNPTQNAHSPTVSMSRSSTVVLQYAAAYCQTAASTAWSCSPRASRWRYAILVCSGVLPDAEGRKAAMAQATIATVRIPTAERKRREKWEKREGGRKGRERAAAWKSSV